MAYIIYHIKYNLESRIYQILLLSCHLLLIFVREKGEGGRVSFHMQEIKVFWNHNHILPLQKSPL